MPCTAAVGKIIYVDDDATGAMDGSSWENAYNFLQEALADANSADKPVEIRVAQGIYRPNEGLVAIPEFDWRTATFQLINGVTLRGGYAGFGEPDPNVRDIEAFGTILSGDLNGDDVGVSDPCDLLTEPTRADHSYTIVTGACCSRLAVLDGFTISSGNAIGSGRHQIYQRGAALIVSCYPSLSYPSIVNCTFTDNSAYLGGAVFVIGGRPELIDCRFLRNAATRGGALMNSVWRTGAEEEPVCQFLLKECIFTGNYAADTGGGICVKGDALVIDNSVLMGNHAGIGGAVYFDYGTVNMINCLLIHNAADEAGGATYFAQRDFNMTRCTFFGNAAEKGNALACLTQWDEDRRIIPSATLANTILWEGGNEICISDHVEMRITYSDIQSGRPGTGNIDADPCFADPGYWADANDPNITAEPNDPNAIWVEGDYHLKSQAGRWDLNRETWVQDDVTSPCIDVGDMSSPVGQEPFPNGGIVNMGAYGGTTEASKSYFGGPVCETIVAGDINGDCKVDFKDFVIMAHHWLEDNNP
jgi:predicted outer membrane repeat protein